MNNKNKSIFITVVFSILISSVLLLSENQKKSKIEKNKVFSKKEKMIRNNKTNYINSRKRINLNKTNNYSKIDKKNEKEISHKKDIYKDNSSEVKNYFQKNADKFKNKKEIIPSIMPEKEKRIKYSKGIRKYYNIKKNKKKLEEYESTRL